MEGAVEAVLKAWARRQECSWVVRMSCGLVRKEITAFLVELVFEFPYDADSKDNHTGLVADGDYDEAHCSLRLLVMTYTEAWDG